TLHSIIALRQPCRCPHSFLSDRYRTARWLAPGEPADILVDPTITAPSVSPLKEKIDGNSMSVDTPVNTSDSAPPASPPSHTAGPTRPSGLSPAAIGAARAKMANAMSYEVRSSLHAQLTCLG